MADWTAKTDRRISLDTVLPTSCPPGFFHAPRVEEAVGPAPRIAHAIEEIATAIHEIAADMRGVGRDLSWSDAVAHVAERLFERIQTTATPEHDDPR